MSVGSTYTHENKKIFVYPQSKLKSFYVQKILKKKPLNMTEDIKRNTQRTTKKVSMYRQPMRIFLK